MGKILIIKDANFASVAVDKVTPVLPVTIDLSLLANVNGVIGGSNTWALSGDVYNHKMLPVTAGEKYRITGIAPRTYLSEPARSTYKSKYAFLKNNDTPVQGATPSFSSDPEFSARIVLDFNEVDTVTVPDDAHYMYIFNNDTVVTKPDGTASDALPLVVLLPE